MYKQILNLIKSMLNILKIKTTIIYLDKEKLIKIRILYLQNIIY